MAFHRVICVILSSFITIGLMVCVKMKYHHIGTKRRERGVNGVETKL